MRSPAKRLFHVTLFLYLSAWAVVAYARPLSKGEVQYALTNFIWLDNQQSKMHAARIQYGASNIKELVFQQEHIAYVLELDPAGFIIAPRFTELSPIKFISYSGRAEAIDQNPFLQELIYRIYHTAAQLGYIRVASQSVYPNYAGSSIPDRDQQLSNEASWSLLLSSSVRTTLLDQSPSSAGAAQVVGPFLTSKWDQGNPYNAYLPTLNNSKVPTGCVATAMAQIMYFWKWPSKGNGVISYSWNGQTLFGDFNRAYEWAYLQDAYSGSEPQSIIDPIATLMRDVAYANRTDFAASGSGARIEQWDNPIVRYFKYSPDAESRARLSYSDSNAWFLLLKEQMDNKWPVLMSIGSHSGDLSHAVVVDGYRLQDGMSQIHVNMGWGGLADNYYTVDDIYGYGGTSEDSALINIYPPNCAESGSIVGRVVDQLGRGVGNVRVKAYSCPSCYRENRWTDSDGYFLIDCIAPGNYRLWLDPSMAGDFADKWYLSGDDYTTASEVTVSKGVTTNLADAVLDSAGRIQGTVVDELGRGVEQIWVSVYQAQSSSVGQGSLKGVNGAYTDSSGQFIVNTLRSGNYRVLFSVWCIPSTLNLAWQWYGGAATFDESASVQVQVGKTTSGVNARLVKGGTVKGITTDSHGNAIEGAIVNFYYADIDRGTIISAITDSSGAYTMNKFPTGRYKVFFGDPLNRYPSEWFSKKKSYSTADIVLVNAGETTNDINFQLNACPTITLSPTSLPVGQVGTAYSQSITASPAARDYYFYYVSSGRLPAGLGLSRYGTLSGTPSAPGTADFTIEAIDTNACAGFQAYSLTVVNPQTNVNLSVLAGGVAATSTLGATGAVQVGYATVTINAGAAPYGTAVFSFKQNGVTVSEAGVPASPPTTSARIFIDYRSGVAAIPGRISAGTVSIDTGIAVVNYSSASANLTYTLRNVAGATLASGHGTLAAGAHFAKFIEQLKDAAPDFVLPLNFQTTTQFASLEISSDQLTSVLALRMTTNQRNEVLFTTTPTADLTQPATNGVIFFPQFADGGGYTTSLVLLNTSNGIETGTLQILDDYGNPLVVNPVGGTAGSAFRYSIPNGGVVRFQTDGSPATIKAGWAQLTPDAGTSTPIGAGVFGYNPGNFLVTESGIPATVSTKHARIYVDLSGGHDTGLAIANPTNANASITITAFQSDGVTGIGTSQGPLQLPANGHSAFFADQFIAGLPAGFTGVLDIISPAPFAALTMRSLYNERNDWLLATFPIADMTLSAPSPIVFPQIADGGGYVTQFILIGAGGASSVTLNYYGEDGKPLPVGK